MGYPLTFTIFCLIIQIQELMTRLSDSESSHSAAQREVDRLTVSVSQTESELHRLQQQNSQQGEKIGHLNDDKTNLGKIELFVLLL